MFRGSHKVGTSDQQCESITIFYVARNMEGRQRCVLVEGAPGIGKSTLAWMMCREWGQGKLLHTPAIPNDAAAEAEREASPFET